jgi:nucleoid-associated protein YgaU
MMARKMFYLILACIAFIFVSCDIVVPIKEMVKARVSISKARTVMAEKFDPENLNKAEEQLYKCHDFVVNKKESDAKKAAVKSLNYAEIAIQTSLPQAVDEVLGDAKTIYQEAEKLNAEQSAPEKYAQAGNAINEAEKLKGDQNLYDAFLKSKEALAAGTQAKEISLAKAPEITEAINAMKKDVDTLQSIKLTDQQKQELDGARANLDKAAELVAQNNLKEAVTLMTGSGNTINKIKTAARKISAKERIAQLRKEVEQLKKDRGSEFAGEDLEVVVTALNEADSLLEQDKTDEASQKITDAENSLAIAREKTTKGLAIDKSKSVEKLLEDARKKDTRKKFQSELDRAAEMIAEGKKLLGSEMYKDSLQKFEEAEFLINSLSVAGEKDRMKDKGTIQDLEGKRVYKVIYNKKKRDCLWRIADKVYRNARLWPLIYMANKDQIKDPDLIFPGQKFIIPEVPAKKEKGTVEPEKKDEIKDGGKDTGTKDTEEKKVEKTGEDTIE